MSSVVASLNLTKRREEKGENPMINVEKLGILLPNQINYLQKNNKSLTQQQQDQLNNDYCNNTLGDDDELKQLVLEPSFRKDRYQKIMEMKQQMKWPSFIKFFQAKDFKCGEYKTIIEIEQIENPSNFLFYFMSHFNNISHPNIVPYLDTYITKNSCCLVTPFYPNGTLLKLLKLKLEKQKSLKLESSLQFFNQLLNVLVFIHNNLNTTMYGCITMENIFLDDKMENLFVGYLGIHHYTMNDFLNFYKNNIKIKLIGNANHNSNNNGALKEKEEEKTLQTIFKDEDSYWKYLDVYAIGIIMFQILTLTLEENVNDQQSPTLQYIQSLLQQQQLNEEELNYYNEYIKTKIQRLYHNYQLTKLISDMLNIQSKMTAKQCLSALQEIHQNQEEEEEEEN
ncbi:hypothetical protein ABK040_015706 [Willaertia magna]